MKACGFEYEHAFVRNLGWITEAEQVTLRGKKVAIAGLGGVGGSHLITLARLGVSRFSLSDFDRFDWANFNRQAGAMVSTVGQPKIDVMCSMALDVNPELEIDRFPEGVSEANIDRFLEGVDLYVDSLDFFVFETRALVFRKCREKKIPAITAAPLGMGVAFLAFTERSMSFDDYFRLQGCDDFEKAIRFAIGLAPAGLHIGYLADATRVKMDRQEGPSTAMSIQLCAGVIGVQALKLLLSRGPVPLAPRSVQFDPYTWRMKKIWLPWGNANPLQRVRMLAAKHMLKRRQAHAEPPLEAKQLEKPERTGHKPMAIVEFSKVSKKYLLGAVELPVLKDVSFQIKQGQFVVLLGPSGSGKSTLLNLVGGLDKADEGRVLVGGHDLAGMNDDRLTDFRGENIGFVFQSFNLIPVLSAAENIAYPLINAKISKDKAARRVRSLLAAMGLEDRGHHLPGELSGGQRQRVAIARALVKRPKLVVADEPTANLDSKTTDQILSLMRGIQTRYGISFLLASHDPRVVKQADTIIHLLDGKIQKLETKEVQQ